MRCPRGSDCRRCDGVISRPRVFAIASVAAIGAALATGVSQTPAAGSVSFTSQAGVSQLFAHYVVTPTSRGTSGAAATASADEGQLATLWAKGSGPASLVGATGGVNAGSSASGSSTTATPNPAESFIGQQSSATTCSYFGHGCNPPDMAVAASPQFVLQGVNTQFEVLS